MWKVSLGNPTPGAQESDVVLQGPFVTPDSHVTYFWIYMVEEQAIMYIPDHSRRCFHCSPLDKIMTKIRQELLLAKQLLCPQMLGCFRDVTLSGPQACLGNLSHISRLFLLIGECKRCSDQWL